MYSKNTLTERQNKILLILNQSDNLFVATERLLDIFSVGEKSIYNDINTINRADFGGAIEHIGNGYQLKVFDEDKKIAFISSIGEKLKYNNFSDSNFRANTILCRLLKAKDYVRSVTLQDKLYISKSTLTSDLAKVRIILDEYNLSLETKPHYGLKIVGDENDIRKLIVQKLANIYLADDDGIVHVIHAEEISQILANVLLKYQFKVSDIVFQNLIIHIATSIQRVRNGNFLPTSKELPLLYYHAKTISEEIFANCSKTFDLPFDGEEIKAFTIELQCKRDYEHNISINEEINDFVFNCLLEINHKQHVDLTNDLDLRISLALHTTPLLNRLENDMQLTNSLTMDVKQNFPYAYDIATHYAHLISKRYSFMPREDEIAYLALHFIAALKKKERATANHSVLLICEQRKSNTILIQQQLLNWFKDDVSAVNIINILEIENADLDFYDVIITTSNEVIKEVPNAVLINLFPNDKDRVKIEMAFEGITKSSDVLTHFHKEMFFTGNVKDKEELINILCQNAEDYYHLDDSFKESVLLHESFANTFFGNHIAMPHPDTFITDESFISVGIPENPITWDNEPDVQLILLVSIKKDDPKALRIWQYLSFLITDDTLLKEIVQNPSYDNFYNTLSKFYKHMLDK